MSQMKKSCVSFSSFNNNNNNAFSHYCFFVSKGNHILEILEYSNINRNKQNNESDGKIWSDRTFLEVNNCCFVGN